MISGLTKHEARACAQNCNIEFSDAARLYFIPISKDALFMRYCASARKITMTK